MEFSLGYIASNNQLRVRDFSIEESSPVKLLDLSEINNTNLSALLVDSASDSLQLPEIQKQNKFYPLQEASRLNISAERFNNLTLAEAQSIQSSMLKNWTLSNNLLLLSNLVEITNQFVHLWPDNRNDFFE